MIALIQRVTEAQVVVDKQIIGQINYGLLALVGVEKNDQKAQADKLLNKLLGYRVFSDQDDKMNLSLKDSEGGLLVVPQFTLAANTVKGLRPSFSSAAPPADGKVLFDYFCQQATLLYPHTEFGRFGADMQVSLTNDGPVTFWLQIS